MYTVKVDSRLKVIQPVHFKQFSYHSATATRKLSCIRLMVLIIIQPVPACGNAFPIND